VAVRAKIAEISQYVYSTCLSRGPMQCLERSKLQCPASRDWRPQIFRISRMCDNQKRLELSRPGYGLVYNLQTITRLPLVLQGFFRLMWQYDGLISSSAVQGSHLLTASGGRNIIQVFPKKGL